MDFSLFSHNYEDKLYSAVQHWRLQALSRAFNKWRQVALKGLLSQLIEEEEKQKIEKDEKITETPSTTERRGQRNNTEVRLIRSIKFDRRNIFKTHNPPFTGRTCSAKYKSWSDQGPTSARPNRTS